MAAFVFALEVGVVSLAAGEIEAVAASEPAIVPQLVEEGLDLVDRAAAAAIGVQRVLRSDLVDQIDEWCVDLILQQPGARQRAASSDGRLLTTSVSTPWRVK